MPAQGEADGRVVGGHVLAEAGQRDGEVGLGGLRHALEQRQRCFDAGDGPAGAVAVAAEALQRAGLREQRLMAAIDAGAMAEIGDVDEGARCA